MDAPPLADARGLASKPTPKRVRARVNGTIVADSTATRMLIYDHYPHHYAFPLDHLDGRFIGDPGPAREDPLLGTVREAALLVGDRVIDHAVRFYDAGPAHERGMKGMATIDWGAADAWYEESQEVYIHPRDPDKRIDALPSSRHIQVEIDGVTVADTHAPVVLIEAYPFLPIRYYLPAVDVDFSHLRPSDTRTGCPYKGFARYHHAEVDGRRIEDAAWVYDAPFPEVQPIIGRVCFFNERVDIIENGVRLERPKTPWA